jgi:hypothetical protein
LIVSMESIFELSVTIRFANSYMTGQTMEKANGNFWDLPLIKPQSDNQVGDVHPPAPPPNIKRLQI